MEYLNGVIFCLSTLIFLFLAFQAVYLFVFAMAGHLRPLIEYPRNMVLGSFVIFIPSYKEDAVIVETAMAALMLNYPADKRKVVVIADSLQASTLERLRSMPIQVVEVSFDKSTKAKALNVALSQTDGTFDYVLVLDADNICAPDFLIAMNDALKSGYQLVQGQRVAKNTNTPYALLDAVSEGINNHIFRKGHRALGFSCAVIGSGMAMDYALFKQIMPEITAVGGFDKEMELRLLKQRICFGYAEKALVYDEKTPAQATFENQRRRWMSAQLHYLKIYFADGFVQLFKGNVDFFDKVMQTLLLPRVILLGIMPLFFFLSLLHGPFLPAMYWFAIWAATYLAILLSVPRKFVNRQLLTAVCRLPMASFAMFKLFFKLKGANKTFIHTTHGNTK